MDASGDTASLAREEEQEILADTAGQRDLEVALVNMAVDGKSAPCQCLLVEAN